jgi:C-terminal peptidase prc
MEIVVTGCEREVVDRMARGSKDAGEKRFANALDQTLAALVDKAYPTPKAEVLAANAVEGVCKEFVRVVGRSVTAEQKRSWVALAHTSGSFESMLTELGEASSAQLRRGALIDAGLAGMLESTGWLLSPDQAAEIIGIAEAREGGTEPGVLGLDLSGWPVVKPARGSPAAEAGLRSGDTVLTVNDTDVSAIRSKTDVARLLAGFAGEKVTLTVKRGDETLTYQVRRVPRAAWMVRETLVAPGVVCIKIPSFEGSGVADKVGEILRKRVAERASAVILDLRDNPGGRPEEANGVADAFLDDKVLQIFEFRGGRRVAFKSNAGALGVRVFLLTNNQTGSGAEALAMALRDNGRGTIVGERTAGMLFGKEIVKLDDGRVIVFRTEPTILSPTGRDYSPGGIPPDVMVEDVEASGHDPVLEQAIKLASAGMGEGNRDRTGGDLGE